MELSLIYIPPEILKHIAIYCDLKTLVIMTFVSTGMKVFIASHFTLVRFSLFSLCRYAAKHNFPTIIEWVIGEYNCEDVIYRIVTTKRHLGVTKWLCKKSTKLKEYILFTATRRGHLDMVKWFFTNDLHNICSRCDLYIRMLIAATKNGQLNIINWLINRRMSRIVRISISDWIRTKSLEYATINGHLHIIKWLWTRKNNMNRLVPYPIIPDTNKWSTVPNIAARYGHVEILDWYHIINPTECAINLHCAVASGHLEILKWASQNGYAMDYSIYRSALECGQIKILYWLLGLDNFLYWDTLQSIITSIE
jgi:hypothetical protein